MIKVSVIVPVWGVEKYIDKCLKSLVNQTLDDIEIIIVNDESPDNSQKIIDDYKKKYPNKIVSLKQKNAGQGAARNYGLKYAKGEYIGYVDSDDYIELNMFEKMYNKAVEEKLDLVICCYKNIFEKNNKEKIEKLFQKTEDDITNAFFNNIGVWNKLYKRELLTNIEFKSKVWYEDFAFTCKVIMKSKKINFIEEGLYNYVIRNGSTMNNNNTKRNLEILNAFDDILSYIEKNKQYKKYYPQIEYLAIYHIFIATIVRVINSKEKINKRIIIKKINNYIITNFPNYKNNKYLKLLDKNKKIVYNLIRLKQYLLIKFIFKLKEIL